VMLDVPGDPEQAVAAVAQVLTARGWRSIQRRTPRMRPGGFLPAGSAVPRVGTILCDDNRQRQLTVSANPGEADVADVSLRLDSDPNSFAQRNNFKDDIWMFQGPTSIFPVLTPPPGMSQWGGGGGGGGASCHTSTILRGDLPVDAIEIHYREQLAAAGWKMSESAAIGRWAWSTWDFLDERLNAWTCLFTVVGPQGQTNIHHANLLAVAAQGEAGSSGMPASPDPLNLRGGSHRIFPRVDLTPPQL
jgi:hypothetical protein